MYLACMVYGIVVVYKVEFLKYETEAGTENVADALCCF